MDTLISILARHGGSTPDRSAVTIAGEKGAETLTYGTFWDDARRFAHVLGRAGAGPHDVVIIMLKHGPDLYRAFAGAMALGAIPSFMPYPTAKQKPDLF